MRIAEIAPLFVRVPPERYGGTERVVHALTEELVRRGHRVTLFAPATSTTSAELHISAPQPLWELQATDPFAYRILQIEDVVRRSREFDIIHSHVEYLPWMARNRIQAPVITSLHGRLDCLEHQALFAYNQEQPIVSISDAQRRPLEHLDMNWVATVHNGLPLASLYSLGDGDGGYLAYIGRVSPEKDTATAIRVAVRAGIPLKIAAKVASHDLAYFHEHVRPLLWHPLVEWLGELDDDGKNRLLGDALALLLPVSWDEPFGLAFIEALAAGAPIISRPRGSLTEIIQHGRQGFLVETEEELVAACKEVRSIDRRTCREWALNSFSVEKMTSDYEAAFQLAAPMTSGGRPTEEDETAAQAARR
jgi:glycosyltransferase involved in cell wall biosynthesis